MPSFLVKMLLVSQSHALGRSISYPSSVSTLIQQLLVVVGRAESNQMQNLVQALLSGAKSVPSVLHTDSGILM